MKVENKIACLKCAHELQEQHLVFSSHFILKIAVYEVAK